MLNPKEYYEKFNDHTDSKKHKGLKKSTRRMDFDSYSEMLADLSEYFKKPKKIKQKRFQIINESVQMKSVSKVQFGRLNDKQFYFSNGIMSLMMMMMMMNCFCGMVDRRKAFSLISSRDHCQRTSPSRISETPRAGFEPGQNLSSDFVE